jgi:hypothetical protein
MSGGYGSAADQARMQAKCDPKRDISVDIAQRIIPLQLYAVSHE